MNATPEKSDYLLFFRGNTLQGLEHLEGIAKSVTART
jgi:hypothetical protein